MKRLVADIREIVAKGPVNENALERMRNLVNDAVPRLLRGNICECVPAKTPGRYLIYADPDYGFVIMLMIWKEGDETPIHDHGVWGVEAILTNKLHVTSYTPCRVDPKPTGSEVLAAGEVMCNLPPDNDVHKVRCDEKNTLSLHIYGKPMLRNHVFVPGVGFEPRDLEATVLKVL